MLPKCLRSVRIVISVHIPQLGFQGVNDVSAAHQVDEAAAQVPTEIHELMLRVQADRCLAGFQHVHQQELQQEALAHAGVA